MAIIKILKRIGGVIGLIGLITYGFIEFEDSISRIRDGWFVMFSVIIGIALLLLLVARVLRD